MRTLLLLLFIPLVALACGKERWPVKVGTDKDVARVVTAPAAATIAGLHRPAAPAHPNVRTDTRFTPQELRTFTVTGHVTLIKAEADQDYHIVLTDRAGRTMIVEAPEPNCAKGSRFAKEISAVRVSIDEFFGGPVHGKHVPKNVRATVTGVAFFDLIHGQAGVAPNGIELHPILRIDLTGRP